jgi:CRP-like cAMP-binding protein
MAEHVTDAVAFPKLEQDQLDSLGRCPLTTLGRYRDGEKLIETGQRDCTFFVIKSGEVEILDESRETPRTIVVLEPGQFTGEVGGAAHRQPVARQRRRPGRLRSVWSVDRRVAATPE